MDSDFPHGTLGAQRQLAKRSADGILDEMKNADFPELTAFCRYAWEACDQAILIAKWSRDPKNAKASQFVAVYSYLAEYLKRAKALMKKNPDILKQWPENPGISFSWQSGWSALDVALKFAKMILSAVLVARAEAPGVQSRPSFDHMETSGPHALAWRDQTIQELRSRILPPPSDWSMWEIERDFSSLSYKLEAEFSKATEAEAKTKHLKTPSKEAKIAFLLGNSLGQTQAKIAKIMTEKLKPAREYKQYQVSRWLKEYKEWLNSQNIRIADSETTPTVSVDPSVLDMGARTDGKTTGDPRHKAKFDPDHDTSE